MKILIVDDSPEDRLLLRLLLEKETLVVVEASDGVEALARLEHEPVDAIISDILMPRMDGYQFCSRVRASERFRHLPFLFHSSLDTSPEEASFARDLGADGYLRKPSPAAEILARLRAAVAAPRSEYIPLEPPRELRHMEGYKQQIIAKLEQQNLELAARNEELLLSEQLHLLERTALETIANGIVVTDLAGQILWVNPAICALTGYTASEIIGQTPRLFKSGQHTPAFYRDLWTTILEGKTWRGNFTNRRKDGTFYYSEHTITPVRGKDGAIARFVAVVHDVTEKKRSAAALREREEQLRLYAEHSPVAVAMLDREMKYLVVSHRWMEEYHLGDQSIIGRSHYDVFPEIPPHWIEVHRRCLAGATEKSDGEPFTRQDGTLDWIRWEIRPWRRADDAIGGIIIFSENITERRRAEASAHRLAAIVEFSDDAIIGKNLNGIVTSWNRGAEKVFGYSAAEMVGTSILRLIPPERQAEEEQILARIKRGESVEHFETVRQTKDGGRLDISVTVSPIKDANGVVVGASKVARDITERKQAEQQLTLLQTAVSNLNDIVLITEAEPINEPGPRIVFVNEAFERITGYTAAEAIGRSPRFLQGDKTDRRVLAEIRQALTQRQPIRRQVLNYGKDGTEYWLDIDIVPVFNAMGKCTHFAAIERDITERKKTEALIAEQAALLDKAQDAIVVLDLEKKVLFWNQGAERLYGWAREEVLGRDVSEFFYRNYQKFEDISAATINQGEWAGELVHLTKNQREIVVQSRRTLIRDEAGRPKSTLVINTDITEKKSIQAKIAEQAAFLDKARDAILVRDLEGNILFWNQGAERMYGWLRQEVLGRNIGALLYTDPQKFTEVNALTIRNGEWHGELQHLTKNRSEITIEARWTLIRDDEGRPKSVLAINTDITEKRNIQEKIAEQAALLDETQDAIIQREVDGRILFWSKGAARIYGWTREEAIGRNITEILGLDPEWFEKNNRAAQGAQEWSGEYKHFTKDRRELTVEGRCTLIRDREGRPKSVLVINTDITEKKKIEAQFMRAQRMESIGTLASGIAHDLNNILAPIMMSIDILKNVSDSPEARKILDTIEVSAKRGADIVRQVLSFARGMEGERIEVQPKHLLKDIESIIKDTFPKDIRLRFSAPRDIWTILGDPTQLHQILLNLCVNARDAMPHGGALTVQVENCALDEQYAAMNIQAKPGRYVCISVTDTGTGIPPELLEKIFEPFFTTKALNKGTGLGLSTVMAVVKSHEGVLNVYSEPGQGTTFKVYLPALETTAEARQEQTEQASMPRGNGETILIIDDEASILTITSQTLQAFGYRVLTATDGAEGVAVYAQHRGEIAVVITDMMMPVMDGSATIHALLRVNPAVKIVAASGLNANGGVAKAAGAGLKHFLTKPYTAEKLLKTMRAILDEA